MLKMLLVWLIADIVGSLCWMVIADEISDSVILFGIAFFLFVVAIIVMMIVPAFMLQDLFSLPMDSNWDLLFYPLGALVAFGAMHLTVMLIYRMVEG